MSDQQIISQADHVPLAVQGAMQAAFPYTRMLSEHANVGAVEVESQRAVAEARGQIQLAKMFPRSLAASISEFLDACKSPEFAAIAFYSVPNRGAGQSIRFAEEAARCFGNFEYGHRELSRSEGKSEIEVYAWDKEKNNYSRRQITVLHVIDTKNGPRRLTDQADIDNRIANIASKQVRGRILALLPKHMVAAGTAECKRTLAGDNEKPLSARVQGMVNAFSKYGITPARLTKHLGHAVDDTTTDELADLIGIYNALKDGAKPSDYFGGDGASDGKAEAIVASAQQKAADDKPPAAAEKSPATAAEKATKKADSKSQAATKAAPEPKEPEAAETTAAPTQDEAKSEPDEPAPADPAPSAQAPTREDLF